MEEFIDVLQDYILLIKDGKIKFYNKALRDLLGDNLKELNYLNILELLTDKDKSDRYIIINDKNDKEVIFQPIIKNIIIEKTKLRLITLKELKSKSYNIGDLELILDNIPLIVWIKDINGKYVYANKRYADVLCIDKSEIIGKDDSYIWDINQSNIFKNEDRKIIEEKGYLVMPQKVNIGNKYMWHNVRKFSVLDEFEKVKFIMGFADNISDKITLNEKKSVLEHEIQMETLKNEFFTNISHEFKTPLNIIISASKLINTYIENRAKENLNGIILKKYTRSIEKNAFRLERLINNLIDITKIDSGDYEISINNYNIVSLVENIALAVVDYIRSEDISIIFDTNKEEKIVKCDKESIERIILNLLSNSIKHIHGEGNIVVNINAYEDYVDITVKDDGEGIPKEYIENVFNKFGQVDKSLSRKHEGSGLGLFIVKSLVEMHGGLINIESEVGVGTEVTIRLYSNELENSKEVNAEVEELINKCGKEFSDIYCI
ncbi:PAS domain-containing sensor histidine kinase [Clostridium tertium]